MDATAALSEHLRQLGQLSRTLMREGTNHAPIPQGKSEGQEARSTREEVDVYLKSPSWMSNRQRLLVVLNEMLDAFEDLEPAHPVPETQQVVAEMYLAWCATPTFNLHRSYMFERRLVTRLPGATVIPVCRAADGSLVHFQGDQEPTFWLVQDGTWYGVLPIPHNADAFKPFSPLYAVKGGSAQVAPRSLRGIDVPSGVFSSQPIRFEGVGTLHF